MLTNVDQIPSVGCFRLSLGHSAVGNFAGHVLTINVNKEGEACQVDGSPFNCSGCIDSSRDGCPAKLNVHSRDDDGFINFNVARKFADNAYAGTQEGLEYGQKLTGSRAKESGSSPAAGIAATPIPDGPYSLWPEETKKKVTSALSFRCMMASTMQLGNYQGSKDAAREIAQATFMVCVDHQMPNDWPDRGKVQSSEKEHFEKAKQIDPTISWSPDDAWREIAKKLKPNDAATVVGKP
jgi:hypothetical protein